MISSCLAWPVAWTSSMPGVHDLGAEPHEPVDHLAHVHLVARDRVRREDHGVALADGEPAVLAVGHAGERRHRLALAAGGDHAHVAVGEVADVLDVDDRRLGDVQQPHLAGQPHVLLHRQAERGDLAAEGDGGIGDLLHAVHVAGEAGDDDAAALVLVEQVVEHRADALLAAAVAVAVGVGGVAHEEAHALVVGDGAHAGEVGEPPVDRGEVELPVARVHQHALRRVERGGEAVGHRVGDRDELHVEGPDLAALAVDDRDQVGVAEQPRLLDAVPGQAQGERRAVDRERQLAQQVREPADVVLVPVGGDAADHAVGVVAQPREVREDQVDPEVLELREHEPAVEEQQLVVLLEDHAVAADLAQAAEERDRDGRGHGDGQAQPSRPRPSSTRRASSSRPSGSGPIGRRHGPPGWPSTRRATFTASANWAISRLS